MQCQCGWVENTLNVNDASDAMLSRAERGRNGHSRRIKRLLLLCESTFVSNQQCEMPPGPLMLTPQLPPLPMQSDDVVAPPNPVSVRVQSVHDGALILPGGMSNVCVCVSGVCVCVQAIVMQFRFVARAPRDPPAC